MIENLIILILLTILFALGLQKKINGLYIIIFLIPYQGIYLKGFDISILLIFAYFFGYIYENKNFSVRSIHYKKYVISFILIFIISLGVFVFKGQKSDFLLYYGWTAKHALLHYIKPFIASILLYILINNIVHNYNQIRKCLFSFTLSISYYFITWFFDFILNLGIPSFLKTVYQGTDRLRTVVPQFTGYNGEGGLTSEYTLFILAFSFYLFLTSKKLNKKLFYLLIMTLSLIIGVSILKKSYFFSLAIFILTLTYFFLKQKGFSLNKKIYILGLIIILMVFVTWKASTSYVVVAVDAHIERIETVGISGYKFDALIHRPYQKEFNNFWEVCGLIGIGPISALGVRGNHLATHAHYFDLFMKFGLIGLFIYLLFYFRLLKDLFKLTKNQQLAYILFALFVALLWGEVSKSYLNQTNYMLSYWFLFAIIACMNKIKANLYRNKINNNKFLEM